MQIALKNETTTTHEAICQFFERLHFGDIRIVRACKEDALRVGEKGGLRVKR